MLEVACNARIYKHVLRSRQGPGHAALLQSWWRRRSYRHSLRCRLPIGRCCAVGIAGSSCVGDSLIACWIKSCAVRGSLSKEAREGLRPRHSESHDGRRGARAVRRAASGSDHRLLRAGGGSGGPPGRSGVQRQPARSGVPGSSRIEPAAPHSLEVAGVDQQQAARAAGRQGQPPDRHPGSPRCRRPPAPRRARRHRRRSVTPTSSVGVSTAPPLPIRDR